MGSSPLSSNPKWQPTAEIVDVKSQRYVASATVIMDRDSGRSRGFGFVEMKRENEVQVAIAAPRGKNHEGRALTVKEASLREERRDCGGNRGY